jgi:hypothetical protein
MTERHDDKNRDAVYFLLDLIWTQLNGANMHQLDNRCRIIVFWLPSF